MSQTGSGKNAGLQRSGSLSSQQQLTPTQMMAKKQAVLNECASIFAAEFPSLKYQNIAASVEDTYALVPSEDPWILICHSLVKEKAMKYLPGALADGYVHEAIQDTLRKVGKLSMEVVSELAIDKASRQWQHQEHQQEIDNLKQDHQQQLQTLEDDFQQLYQQDMNELQEVHKHNMEEVQQSRQQDIQQFQQTRLHDIEVLRKAHRRDMEQLRQSLQQELEQNKLSASIKMALVRNIPQAVKDPSTMLEYRQTVLPDRPVEGAFAAHKMFARFAIAANNMNPDATLSWDTKMANVEAFAEEIFQWPENSMNWDSPHREGSQSMLVATLIERALREFGSHRLNVSHQGSVVVNCGSELNVRIIGKDGEDSINNTGVVSKEQPQIETLSDILVWFAHKDKRFGNCILAPIVYSANHDEGEKKRHHSEMAGTNIMAAYSHPCIIIDITGGQYISEWKVRASAVVKWEEHLPFAADSPPWRKSVMFEDSGIAGIVGLAAGLAAAVEHFPTEKGDFGSLLSSSAGHWKKEGIVAKVGDTSTSTQENYFNVKAGLIGDFVDPSVTVYLSKTSDIGIIEAKYYKPNWSRSVKAKTTFSKLVGLLRRLHEQSYVHGDIRLTTLLPEGKIIGFEVAGQVGSAWYPGYFQNIDGNNGDRHPIVSGAIANQKIGGFAIEKKHDLYSMAAVMNLFKVNEEASPEDKMHWSKAIEVMEYGKIVECCDTLGRLTYGFEVTLKSESSVRPN